MNITLELDGKKYAGVLALVDETVTPEVPVTPPTPETPAEPAAVAPEATPDE